jgi:hypothetical protein
MGLEGEKLLADCCDMVACLPGAALYGRNTVLLVAARLVVRCHAGRGAVMGDAVRC